MKSILMLLSIYFFISVFLFAKKSPEYYEKRNNEIQPPKLVMDAIGVKSGMIIGEIGAGRGRYTIQLARRVGDSGKIYANDIEEKAIKYLKKRLEKEKIKNVETVLGTYTDPKFKKSSLDMAFMISVYHHIEKPVEVMKKVLPALKKDATLVIVEHDPVRFKNFEHSTDKEVLIKEAKAAGFKLVSLKNVLPKDYIYVFKENKR